MSVRLVTFDLDDTLWKSHRTILRAEQEMRRWIAFHEPRYLLIGREEIKSIRERALQEKPSCSHDVTEIRIRLLRRCFRQAGVPTVRAQDLAERAFAVFLDWRNRVELHAGAHEVLERLRKDYVVASITNGNAQVHKTPLKDCFDFSLSAVEVGSGKPNPELFLAALDRSGVSAKNAVHVGNHLEADIAGALRVGMNTVLVDHVHKSSPPDGVPVVRHLSRLPAVIQALREKAPRIPALRG